MLKLNLTNEELKFIKDTVENQKVEFYKRHANDETSIQYYDLPNFVFYDDKQNHFIRIARSSLLENELSEEDSIFYRRLDLTVVPGTYEKFEKRYPHSHIECVDSFTPFLRNTPYYYYHDRNEAIKNELNFFKIKYAIAYQNIPYIEQLIKVCPSLIYDYLKYSNLEDTTNKMFITCFKNGKNMKEITGLPDWLWKQLINDPDISVKKWDSIRKHYKSSLKSHKEANPSEIDKMLKFSEKSAEKIRKLVNNAKTKDGKPLYTVNSLCDYLGRLDMYQAIPDFEALDILSDYIRMCNDLEIEPITDSNSLKREHDVTARIYNEWKLDHIYKEESEGFKKRYDELSKYAYEDNRLIVIVPKDPKDMVNEGRMNRNCVGSYTNIYARGNSTIFFIRRKDDIEHSYITIETDKIGEEIRQAYYACNQKITDKNDLEFIQKWINHNKKINCENGD